MSRLDNDAYYTPPALAGRLVRELPLQPSQTVLDPSCGALAFVRAAQARGAKARGVDLLPLDPSVAEQFYPYLDGFMETQPQRGHYPIFFQRANFLASDADFPPESVDWVIGNPPYKEAESHVRRALLVGRVGVAMLLRLGFLASLERQAFWNQHRPTVVSVVSPRPSFTGDGKTDGTEYAWFVWERQRLVYSPPALSWIYWDKPKRLKKSPSNT